MSAWREETARHARLAAELRLPSFEWYTPLWAAVDAMLAGRSEDAEALCLEAEEAGRRAGDRNAGGTVAIVRFCEQLQREAYDEGDIAFVADKIANSPAGIAYRGGYSWILAGLGESDRAREQLHATMAFTHAFDTNWLSLQAELAETSVLIGDATFAATLYDRLAPYAGRPVTAGRAVCNYGAVDRSLGGLAALLGRRDDAVRHLEDAIRINDALRLCRLARARGAGPIPARPRRAARRLSHQPGRTPHSCRDPAGDRDRRESLRADENPPRLDARNHELLSGRPRVIGQTAVDLGLAFRVDHEQRAKAPVLGAGERACEQDDAVVGERVHERRVVADARLLHRPASVGPAGPCLADDGEVAHPRPPQARAIK